MKERVVRWMSALNLALALSLGGIAVVLAVRAQRAELSTGVGGTADRVVTTQGSPLEQWECRYGMDLEDRFRTHLADAYSPATKTALRNLWLSYRQLAMGEPVPLQSTGVRVFSQCEEDGLLMFIFAAIGEGGRRFVDIGSADGLDSNCANLAINFGWSGLFVDADEQLIQRGRQFYASHPDTFFQPPIFVQSFVTRENINTVVRGGGMTGTVDLLSVDIDGNDYWIWEALDCIRPRVVIIETQRTFGTNSMVVPYRPDFVYTGEPAGYFGASATAMTKLANRKGYRLVGANAYGFNLIYVLRGVGENALPEVTVESVVRDIDTNPWRESFAPIRSLDYIVIP